MCEVTVLSSLYNVIYTLSIWGPYHAIWDTLVWSTHWYTYIIRWLHFITRGTLYICKYVCMNPFCSQEVEGAWQCVCVCVCARVHACVRGCGCACVCVHVPCTLCAQIAIYLCLCPHSIQSGLSTLPNTLPPFHLNPSSNSFLSSPGCQTSWWHLLM